MKKFLSLAVLMIGFGFWVQPAVCLRPSPNAQTPKEASSKANEDLTELIREREIAKREADRRMKEKEKAKQERANKVVVRVHAGGVDPTSKDSKVIMTTEISKEDLVKRNFSDIRRRAKESQIAYAQNRGADSFVKRASAALGSTQEPPGSSNGTLTIVLLGVMGLLGLWYVRQQNAL